MATVSVVVPVKDGERFLAELLAALAREGPDEVLVIDSGSTDGSVAVARAAGVEVLEIPPEEFGHGRTRNLGGERTSGELLCFLTQDAVPVDGWLDCFREAMALEERVGAAYGPHLPRPETSPMIARELTEFFASMAPDGRPRVQDASESPFLSNVNACYRRECWEQIRFPDDAAYAEDQAFARAMPAAGWRKAFHPGAAVVHAHDYGVVEFARRYFDEYRGLRRSTGHVEPAPALDTLRAVRGQGAGDRRWMRERGWPARRRALWTGRATVHHAGRRVFAALGSRAERLPPSVERALSLEGTSSNGRGAPAGPEPGTPAADDSWGAAIGPRGASPHWGEMLRVSREGPAPLAPPVPGMSDRRRLHVAVAVPAFRRGSGGHTTIFQLVRRLEDLGHTCTIWVHDEIGQARGPALTRRQIVEWFAPVRAPVFLGFDDWHGADVAMATGWETVHPLAVLPDTRARAYLVNDHEPEFFATSAEALFAERTYTLGFFAISASDWLRDLLAERYGCEGTSFRLGVDHLTYRPQPVERRRDTVLFYGRSVTPRRAVPLGMLALEELNARRPGVRVVTFGQGGGLELTFAHRDMGVATPGQLALAYSAGTVGLCLSMTNYLLIHQEMMACGMPCVDLAGGSSEATFGADGPVELADPDPVALADAMQVLLDDPERWRRRSEAGLSFVRDADWDGAALEVEAGLREALRAQERRLPAAGRVTAPRPAGPPEPHE